MGVDDPSLQSSRHREWRSRGPHGGVETGREEQTVAVVKKTSLFIFGGALDEHHHTAGLAREQGMADNPPV